MSNFVEFDAELIRRYGGSVPRYTSYPTALQFDPGFGPEDLRAARSRCQSDAPPSLYLHVPFCSSPCFYCACTRVIARRPEAGERYVERIGAEIASWAALWGKSRRGVRQLHFGGGTPTTLDDRQLAELMTSLDHHFGLIDDDAREYSIEIDPRTVDAARLRSLAAIGFNRVSFGVQDLDPKVQLAINREQPLAVTTAAIDGARQAGFRSIAVDLIYGLPKQTPLSFADSVRQIAALRPDRIAVYAYAHMPAQFPAQRQIEEGDLPDPATRLELLQRAVETFVAAGYRRIGMDHFALETDELARALDAGTLQRNFQGYSTHAGNDLIGIGMSAISRIADCYVQNAKTLDAYAARIDAGGLPVQRGLRLDADDLLRREVIETVMCGGTLDGAQIGDAHGVEFWPYFANCVPVLRQLATDGLIEFTDSGLRVTPRGRPLVRNIARVFDRYAAGPDRERHSAAI